MVYSKRNLISPLLSREKAKNEEGRTKMKSVVFLVAVFATLAFAESTCYSDEAVSIFEKEAGFGDIKWGNVIFSRDGSFETVKKDAGIMKKGRFKGLSIWLHYVFDSDCKLMNVDFNKFDPSNEGKFLGTAVASTRLDGSIQALCYDGNDPLFLDPNTKKFSINKNCICFDEKNRKKTFGKFGCLDKEQIQLLDYGSRNKR